MIINGPNLNLLGKREKAIYGNMSFDDYLVKLNAEFPNIQIDYYQSNIEGELINKLHEVDALYQVILLNAGGYTHTSVALADAVLAIETPVIEVHISNIYAREDFRKHSFLSPHCKAVISGLGLDSYKAALIDL
tara:strand:+ start:192 stop:593 length:402 start_codon:yes stop_codon:yes gene_type:complete